MQVEPFAFAPSWLQEAARTLTPSPRVVAMIRMHDADPALYPNLRDRTDDAKAMLKGLAGDLSAEVFTVDMTGKELKPLGYPTVGAAYVQRFRILAA